jgi:hypothetical protein
MRSIDDPIFTQSAIVAAQDCGIAALGGQAIQFGNELLAGDVAFDQAAEAFTGVFVNDRANLDWAAVGGGVELKVGRPYPVWGIGCRGVHRRGHIHPRPRVEVTAETLT